MADYLQMFSPQIVLMFLPPIAFWFVFKAGFNMGRESDSGVLGTAENKMIARLNFYWICLVLIGGMISLQVLSP